MSEKNKMLFIALDSAEPDLLMEWSRQGLLPNLSALMQAGAWSRLSAPRGFGAGAMWPSLYTGMNIGNHGRYYFEQIQPGSYHVERVTDESSVRSAPVWKVLSDQGVRVCVVDGDRAPLMEELNGRQICDWTTHDPVGPVRSTPAEFARQVVDRYGADPLGAHCDVYAGSAANYLVLRDRLLARIEKKTTMACDYLRKDDWDFFMVSFGDSHDVGHMCWHLHDPAHERYDSNWSRKHGDPILDVYRALDASIGELLKSVPENASVVLFSGPGMEPDYTGNYLLMPVLQRLQGKVSVGTSTSRARLSSVYKKHVPYSIRRRLEAFIKKKSEKSLEMIRSNSRYFQIPHNQNSGAIRINLAGREPNGIIQPGEEFDACCVSLTQDLMQLVDADTGKRIVREVVRVSDHFHGSYMDLLPDLLVVWERHGLIRAIRSEKTGLIQKTYGGSRTGDHSPHCLVVARGEGIRAGEMAAMPAVESVAPTMSEMMGCTMENIDGESFLAAIRC